MYCRTYTNRDIELHNFNILENERVERSQGNKVKMGRWGNGKDGTCSACCEQLKDIKMEG
jgi:hypothetical protein